MLNNLERNHCVKRLFRKAEVTPIPDVTDYVRGSSPIKRHDSVSAFTELPSEPAISRSHLKYVGPCGQVFVQQSKLAPPR